MLDDTVNDGINRAQPELQISPSSQRNDMLASSILSDTEQRVQADQQVDAILKAARSSLTAARISGDNNISSPLLSPTASQCQEDDITSILSDAEQNAQAQLRTTSDILMMAGCVLRRGNSARFLSPTTTKSTLLPQQQRSPAECVLRDRVVSGLLPTVPPLSINTAVSYSPISSSPPLSPTYSNIHLPGKLGSISPAEAKDELLTNNSPVKRTELLSKLDGLDRVIPSKMNHGSNNIMLSPSSSIDTSDELVNKTRSVSEAMKNAHAHANRIKIASKKIQHRTGGNPMGNIPLLNITPPATSCISSSLPPIQTKPNYDNMPLWVQRKIDAEASYRNSNNAQESSEHFGQYEIHVSETIISHEFNRGDWTWTTEWSPDGKYLAMATENHGLAIIEVSGRPIWKVVHDERIGKLKNDSTHSIRSIAWGSSFIALGGTGDAVSIVEPISSSFDSDDNKRYSFDIVDVIIETGFVGTLSWLKNTNILAIGSREDQCLIADIRREKDGKVSSTILHSIDRSDWVTAVQFSHGGTKLAVGDKSGLLSVYLFVMVRPGEKPALSPIQDLPIMDDSILDIKWSPDDQFLYIGGEDYSITILDTVKFSILHRIGRDRWVTFLAPSREGSYLAAGGISSQVSLLDTNAKWKEVTSLPVEGGMPLHATWHPQDEYLSVCGQFENVVVYQSSSQRLPKGRCLRSKSSILAVDFSPDSSMIAVGNETGLVTVFDVQSQSFATVYETVLGIGGDMTIKWSPDGKHIGVASGSTFVLIGTSYSGKAGVHPSSSARFSVRKVLQSGVYFTSLAFSPNSRFLALSDDQTRLLNSNEGWSCVRVLDQSNVIDQSNVVSSAFSSDGSVFAMVSGRSNHLSIYDVSCREPEKWELLFSIAFKSIVSTLCWGPSVKTGLHYLAFGGESETVAILEIRNNEKIWETVLQVPCNSKLNGLDWNEEGMLCVGDDDGTVSIIDLSYLKSGQEVSEMNYNWQRQGIISTTKLSRNFGRNAITSLCWTNSNNSVAIGGTDGILEIIDLSAQN